MGLGVSGDKDFKIKVENKEKLWKMIRYGHFWFGNKKRTRMEDEWGGGGRRKLVVLKSERVADRKGEGD